MELEKKFLRDSGFIFVKFALFAKRKVFAKWQRFCHGTNKKSVDLKMGSNH